VLIAVIAFIPSSGLRLAIGLPFLLFFPGYALVAAISPKREAISAAERAGLSFGLSLAVVPLISLILNFTPWGIRLEPVLYSVTIFIFITSVIAWIRRMRLPEEYRFIIEFQMKLPVWYGGTWNRVLFIILVVVILGAIGTLGYVMAKPRTEAFTEFYILGLEGKAAGYPKEIRVGKEAKITAVIVNHQGKAVSYRVEVRIDGIKNNEVGPILLNDGQKWQETVSFTPDKVGDNQKVDFLLYKNGEAEPCLQPLNLWIDVTK
jgi:uncharacterized membrane protein